MRRLFLFANRNAEWLVLAMLGFAMLWRGGKSLDATWLLAGVAVCVTLAWWGSRPKQESDSVAWSAWSLLLCFVAWTCLAFAFSTTKNYGLDEVLRDTSLALLFLWSARRSTQPSGSIFRDRFVMTVSIATLIACGVGLLVYVFQSVDRFVGTFFDARFHTDCWPNAWADLVLLAWPIVVLWSRALSRKWRTIVLGVVFAALFLSFSRGGFLAFAGQLALLSACMMWIVRSTRTVIKKTMIDWVYIFVLAIALFFAINQIRGLFHSVQSLEAKVTFTAAEGRSSVDERQEFWAQAWELSLERPLVGWGPYSFRFVQPRLQTGVLRTSDHPHNVFLKLAAERGWPAAIFFFAFLAVVLVPVALRVAARKSSAEEILFVVAVVGLLLHSQIDYNLQFVGVALLFWLLLGFLAAREGNTPKLSKKIVQYTELLIAIIIGIVAVSEVRYLVLSSLGRHAEAVPDFESAMTWYERSAGEQFSRDLHLSRANIIMTIGDDEAADRALDDYALQNQEDARLWILRGNHEASRSQWTEALANYDHAYRLAKYNYLEAFEGVLLSLENAELWSTIAERRGEFEQLFAEYRDAILQNTHFIALTTAVEQYEDVSNILIRLYPDAAPSYSAMAAETTKHAIDERERFGSRPGGLLW